MPRRSAVEATKSLGRIVGRIPVLERRANRGGEEAHLRPIFQTNRATSTQEEAQVTITLNHTIVHARDKEAAARFFAQIFGLPFEGSAVTSRRCA